MSKMTKLSAAVIVLVNAVVLLLNGIEAVDWSDVQVGLVMAVATTGSALLLSIYSHVQPGTSKEAVAVGASLTTFAAALTALLSGFQVWHLTDAQNGLVIATVTAIVGVFSALFARENVNAPVTPPIDG